MSSFEKIRQSIKPELDRVNGLIRESLHTSNTMMDGIVDGYLESKGKQIRPMLVVLSAKLLGSVTNRTIASAAAIETLHNATLIHDDVVDETRRRRGRDTINAVWDNHVAVLVGDFFVSTSLQLAIAVGSTQAVEILAALGRTLSLGEIDQIDKARGHCLTEESYFGIIASKTASLFEACVKLGGLSCDASGESIALMTEYARLLGLCFQIRDDIFDYFPDSATGKPSGNDLREGKVTLPLLHALQAAPAEQAEHMRTLLEQPELSAADIDTLTMFARDNGGIDYAYATMERLHHSANKLLRQLPESATRADFASLFDFIITRTF